MTKLAPVSMAMFYGADRDSANAFSVRVPLSDQKVMNKQGSMETKNVNETIMEIFEVTGFADILTIV